MIYLLNHCNYLINYILNYKFSLLNDANLKFKFQEIYFHIKFQKIILIVDYLFEEN